MVTECVAALLPDRLLLAVHAHIEDPNEGQFSIVYCRFLIDQYLICRYQYSSSYSHRRQGFVFYSTIDNRKSKIPPACNSIPISSHRWAGLLARVSVRLSQWLLDGKNPWVDYSEAQP